MYRQCRRSQTFRFFRCFLIHRILSFPWIFSSMSLEIFDMKKLKRSPPRFSLFHGHGLVVFMHLHRHSTIRHVFKRLKRKFSQHKWREMMQNSNPCCQTRHVSKAKNKTSNLLWWRDSWKMVKIPRLQAGNKKIRNQVYKTCRQHAWNWLRMIEDVGHLGHIQPYRSLVQLRKPPVCHHAGLNFEPSFPITLARRSLGSAVIGSMLPFCQRSDLPEGQFNNEESSVKRPATTLHV